MLLNSIILLEPYYFDIILRIRGSKKKMCLFISNAILLKRIFTLLIIYIYTNILYLNRSCYTMLTEWKRLS